MDAGYWVYILASRRNGTLYVGVTNDLSRRVSEHRAGLADGFTAKHGVTRLVHAEPFADVDEARHRERQLKRWRREWKLDLIEASNPAWDDRFDQLNRQCRIHI